MGATTFFKRKKTTEEDAHYNEDNLIKMRESKGLESKVITVKTGVRIINLIGAIVGLAIFAIIAFGIYYIGSQFIDFDAIIASTEQTNQSAPAAEKNSIAQEAYAVWPPNPAL